eukprot:TRINITY_DN19180_c0_g1_i1.p1 TRINITY_DN19180_c0_g1~~TRINITY_DN19180_c0_g1_i1.p1  ORF type:complete len:473 (-),score=87.75 TRINITY_DN19180_c0_g1_i1:123-1541(-)
MEGYVFGRFLAEGRFGTVFEAVQTSSGTRVAVKKVRSRRPMAELGWDPWSRSAQREVEVLSKVQHCNVVALLDYSLPPSGVGVAFMVYEFLSWDLASLIDERGPLEAGLVKTAMHMLFHGLAHLHLACVVHRDLKPSNLLLDTTTGVLKIADFGSARFLGLGGSERPPVVEAEQQLGKEQHDSLHDGVVRTHELSQCAQSERQSTHDGALTVEVCTRWFKAPEMLFGSVSYTQSVDLWAVGCTLGELLSPEAKAVFPGGSDIDQLCRIFHVLGTPTETNWPDAHLLPDFGKIEFARADPRPFEFQDACPPEALVLLQGLLKLNPKWRLTVTAALASDYFKSEPSMEDPLRLVEGLDPEGRTPLAGRGDGAGVPLSELSNGSGNSFFAPGAEFERVDLDADIETTTCGLFGDDFATFNEFDGQGDEAQSLCRSGTPPPPADGVHRFREDPLLRRSGTPPPPADGVHRFRGGSL